MDDRAVQPHAEADSRPARQPGLEPSKAGSDPSGAEPGSGLAGVGGTAKGKIAGNKAGGPSTQGGSKSEPKSKAEIGPEASARCPGGGDRKPRTLHAPLPGGPATARSARNPAAPGNYYFRSGGRRVEGSRPQAETSGRGCWGVPSRKSVWGGPGPDAAGHPTWPPLFWGTLGHPHCLPHLL